MLGLGHTCLTVLCFSPSSRLPSRPSAQQASYAASSFSSVSYCVQQTKVAFTPEDSSATQGISVSVSNSFLSRHGNLPVPSVSAPCRSRRGTWWCELPFVACALRCVCRCSPLPVPFCRCPHRMG